MQKHTKINVFLFSGKKINFEKLSDSKLRRNLKSSLELNNIKYINNPIDEKIEIVHFLNFEDHNRFNYFKNKNYIRVASVLVNEKSLKGRLFHKVKNKDSKEYEYHIPKRTVDILNSFDYLIAPSNLAKEDLIKEGVSSDIKVLTPMIKLTKVNLENTGISNIVYIYFHLEEGAKYFFVPLDSLDEVAAERIKVLASIYKEYKFIIYSNDLDTKEARKVRKVFKKHAGNILICSSVEEDVYYSTLYHAKAMILLNDTPQYLSELMEAFATKTPVLALQSAVFTDIAIDKENSYVYNNFASLIKGVDDLIHGQLEDLSENAFNFAYENRVQPAGLKLLNIYENMLKEKKNI